MTGARPRGRRRGVALLLVLVVLTLASASLALLASSTRGEAERIGRHAAEVQRRWAARSAADALAPAAPALLGRGGEPAADVPAAPRRPLAIERRIRLGAGPVSLLLVATDEQAKLDLNALPGGPTAAVGTQAEATVASLAAAGPGEAAIPAVRLRPLATLGPASVVAPVPGGDGPDPAASGGENGFDPDGFDGARDGGADGGGDDDPDAYDDEAEADAEPDPEPARRFLTLNQALPGASPALLLGPRPGAGAAARLTSWGAGKTNWWSAPPEVLRAALSGLLPPAAVGRAVASRARGVAAAEALRAAAVGGGGLDGGPGEDAAPGAEGAGRFVDRSDRFGLWVVASGGLDLPGRRGVLVGSVGPWASSCRFRVVDARGGPVAEVAW